MMANFTKAQPIIEQLTAISGPEHLRSFEDTISIAPANLEEIAATLRCAGTSGLSVTPFGSGSKQAWGKPPQASLMLQIERLNVVKEHTWQDMTCTVEAGCTWSSLESTLATHGQFVALDPLWPNRATVGGIVATNDSGSLRLKYGSLRDLVIGMTVVLADGTIARTGGKVVKNVAGYDLHKLMTGAMGTLGVIAEVTFRLHSIPKHMQSFTIASPDAGPLGRLLLKILDSYLSAQSIQLRSNHNGFALDICLATLPSVIQDQAFSLSTLAQSFHLTCLSTDPDVWSARERQFDGTDSVVVKATMLPTDIAYFAQVVDTMGGTSATQAMGIMTASIPVAASLQILQLRKDLEDHRGSLTILHQPEESKLNPWGTPPDTLTLMRALKDRFDPTRILNPGRFLGEI